MKTEGKMFHGALGIKLKLNVFKKIHSFLLLASTFSWLPALFPCPGAASLLVVGLKSNEDLGAWSPWKERAGKHMDSGRHCSVGRVRGGTLEVIAGGHGGSQILPMQWRPSTFPQIPYSHLFRNTHSAQRRVISFQTL